MPKNARRERKLIRRWVDNNAVPMDIVVLQP